MRERADHARHVVVEDCCSGIADSGKDCIHWEAVAHRAPDTLAGLDSGWVVQMNSADATEELQSAG